MKKEFLFIIITFLLSYHLSSQTFSPSSRKDEISKGGDNRYVPRRSNYTIGVAQNTDIKGKVNAPILGENLHILLPHNVLSQEEKTLQIPLDGRNQFNLSLDLSSPTIAQIQYAGKTRHIFIEPGDELNIEINSRSFPKEVLYKGKPATQNTFLALYYDKFQKYDNLILNKMIEMKPSDFRFYMNQLKRQQWKFTRRYQQKHKGELSSNFVRYIQAEIEYYWASHLLQYHFKNTTKDISPNYYNFLSKIKISNNNAILSPSYLSFLDLYQNFRNENLKTEVLNQIKQGVFKCEARTAEIKNEPNGEIGITAIFKGERAKFLGLTKSGYERIGGRKTLGTWYQVGTNDGYIGWVFGENGTIEGTNIEEYEKAIQEFKTIEEIVESITRVATVNVDRLRIRKHPNTPTPVGFANVGQELDYLGRKSSQKYTFTLRGQSYNDHFYQVITPSGEEGWVFGGGIEIVDKKSLKKISKKIPVQRKIKAHKEIETTNPNEMYLSGRALYYTTALQIYKKSQVQPLEKIEKELNNFLVENPYKEYSQALQAIYTSALRDTDINTAIDSSTVAVSSTKTEENKTSSSPHTPTNKESKEETAQVETKQKNNKEEEEKKLAEEEARQAIEIAKIKAEIAQREKEEEQTKIAQQQAKEEQEKLRAAEKIRKEQARDSIRIAKIKAKELKKLAKIEKKKQRETAKIQRKNKRIEAKKQAALAKIRKQEMRDSLRLLKVKQKEEEKIAELQKKEEEVKLKMAQKQKAIKEQARKEVGKPNELTECILNGLEKGIPRDEAEQKCKEYLKQKEEKEQAQLLAKIRAAREKEQQEQKEAAKRKKEKEDAEKEKLVEQPKEELPISAPAPVQPPPANTTPVRRSMNNFELLESLDITEIPLPKTQVSFSGIIKNHKRNKAARIILYPDAVSMEEVSYNLFIRGDGTFSTVLSITRPTRGKFTYGSRLVEIYLQPGDNLSVSFSSDNFKNSLEFSGQGGDNNNYLKQFSIDFLNQDKEAKGKVYSENNPMSFKRFLDKIHQEKLNYLYQRKKQLDPLFSAYAQAQIDYWYAYYLTNYRWEHPLNYNRPAPMKIGNPSYYDFMNKIQLNNTDALSNEYYAYFLDVYFDDRLKEPQNKGLTKIELAERYLNGEVKYYYQAKQLDEATRNGRLEEVLWDIKYFMDRCTHQPYRETVKTALRKSKTMLPGMPAPNFTLKDINGKLVSLSDFKGKVIYLDFWATYCTPCLQFIANTSEMRRIYTAKDVVFIYISLDNTQDEWRRYVKRHKITGVHLFSDGKLDAQVARDYGVKHLPATFIIDQKGRISKGNTNKKASQYSIEELLNKLLHAPN